MFMVVVIGALLFIADRLYKIGQTLDNINKNVVGYINQRWP